MTFLCSTQAQQAINDPATANVLRRKATVVENLVVIATRVHQRVSNQNQSVEDLLFVNPSGQSSYGRCLPRRLDSNGLKRMKANDVAEQH